MSEHTVKIVNCKSYSPPNTADIGEAIIDGVCMWFTMDYTRHVPILTLDNKEVRKHPDYKAIRIMFWYELQYYKSEHPEVLHV